MGHELRYVSILKLYKKSNESTCTMIDNNDSCRLLLQFDSMT